MNIPKIEDLKNIALKKYTTVPEESDVNAALEHLAATHPQLKPVLLIRPTRKGDVAVIDFVGSIDGVEFPGGAGQNYPLELGSNSFIPGFEDQLINRNVGEVVNVRVPFPEDYHEKSLAGKMAVFRCTIKELKQKSAPVLDDTFAKQFGLNTVAELRAEIEAHMKENIEEGAFLQLRDQVMNELIERFPVEAPSNIVEQEMEVIRKHDSEITEDDARKIAARRAGQGMLLMEMAKANGVTISDEEVMNALKDEMQQYGPQAPQILKMYQANPELLRMFRAAQMEKKVLKWVISQCAIETITLTPDEFEKMMTE
ncbi:MAG: trigger factor [Thermoguttaceae bacterium]|nr:trigger factor [Thermoguttaceae bacterium]